MYSFARKDLADLDDQLDGIEREEDSELIPVSGWDDIKDMIEE